MQVLATLVWLPQAALIAWSIAAVQAGRPFADLVLTAVAFVALGLLRSGLEAAGIRLSFASARAYTQELRLQSLATLAQRSPLDAERPAAGTVASVLNEQSDPITPYHARYTTARTKVMVVPLCILLGVAWFSWVAALVLLVAAPLIPIFMALVGWRAEAASRQHLHQIGELNQFLLDRIQGLASIRGLGSVGQVTEQLARTADQLRNNTMAVLKIAFLSSAVLELFSALGVALVAVYVGFHLLGQLPFGSWGGQLSLAQAMWVLLLSPAFFEPLRELSAVWHDKAAGVAGEAALQSLQAPGQHFVGSAEAAAPETQAAACTVALEGVSYRYDSRMPLVIEDLDLAIAAGEKVALWGSSGSGKSTVMALIAGLAAPAAGQIVVAGQPMDNEHANALRARMAWVAQKPHLFAASLKENIRLGREIADSHVQAAIDSVALGDVLRQRGNAVIGDGGLGLSGGEALRLTLARAAVHPHCALILADEPTAHLDAETATFVRESLLALAARGATLIVATHDPLLAALMDRVVSLDGSAPMALANEQKEMA